jgi:MoxR-like ATPase
MYSKSVEDIRDFGAADGLEGSRIEHPSAYRPDEGLVNAVNVALLLERPLLVTGDPGTGKTQLAQSLAWQLASRGQLNVTSARVEKFETKSTSVARDLFYSFDVLGRFHAAHSGGSQNNLDYLSLNALGCAIVDGLPTEAVTSFLPPSHRHRGPRRAVVLIDEIDKATRDFPNDLLNELDRMFFHIPELNNVRIGTENKGFKPIVIITSNSERTLPDPFLRRCIYYDIPRPTSERLEDILLARLGYLGARREGLLSTGLAFYVHLRESATARRKISVAELLQWLTFMLLSGAKPHEPLDASRAKALAGLPALIKDPDDQGRVRAELESFLQRL